MLAAALAGLIAGIAVAMPLGAIGVLLVNQAMSAGWRPAAAGATGVALVDCGYATIAVAAGASLSNALNGWERAIHITGAVLLVLIAGRGLADATRVRAVRSRTAGPALAELPASAWRVGARFAGLTALNPLTAVYFVALAAGLGHALDGAGRAGAFVLAVFAASWAWQLALASFGAFAGSRLPPATRRITGVAGYVVVLGYAARLALT